MSAEKPEPGDVWLLDGQLCLWEGDGWCLWLGDRIPDEDRMLFNLPDLLAGDPTAWAAAGEAANRPLSGKSFAPWSPMQVAVLNAFQAEPNCHPFTCGTNSSPLATEPKCSGVLVAEPDGWRCPLCDYRQGWCHNFMLDPAMTQEFRTVRETIGVDKSDVPSAWAAALRFAPGVYLEHRCQSCGWVWCRTLSEGTVQLGDPPEHGGECAGVVESSQAFCAICGCPCSSDPRTSYIRCQHVNAALESEETDV